jgi:PAS domain S-box-containing protein
MDGIAGGFNGRHWFVPPIYPGDEERTRKARQIWTIVLGSSAAVLFWAAVSAIAVPAARTRLLFTLPVILGFAGVLEMNRRGHEEAASRLLLGGTWLGLTVILAMPGGVRETSFAWYLLVVQLASLLRGMRSALIASGASVLASLALLWARQTGVLPPPIPPTLGAAAAAEACIILFLCVLLWVSDRSVAELLGRARRELDGRRAATAALEESEKSLLALLDATTETAFLLDADGRVLALNETLARAWGRPRSDLLGQDAFALLPADLARERRVKVNRVLETGISERFEDLGADGRWYDNSLFPIRTATGAVVRVAVFARDITEQKEAEAALRRYAERLSALHDIDGAILSARSSFEIALAALEGLRKLLPTAELEVSEMDDERRVARVLAAVPDGQRGRSFPARELGDLDSLAAGRPIHRSGTADAPDYFRLAGSPQARESCSSLTVPLLPRGRLIGTLRIFSPSPMVFLAEHIEVVQEVADHVAVALEQARLYEELERHAGDLERAYSKLERLDKAKSDLLNVASHELRTPLSVVMGYGELLEAHPAVAGSSNLLRLANGVRGGARRLQLILQDMLDVSAFERGKRTVAAAEVDLSEVATAVVSELSASASERRLKLVVWGIDGLPLTSGDPDALAKALRHLILNAIKYTPDFGTITVRGKALLEGPEAPWLELSVEDTGIGIDPADQELIFDTFFRLGETRYHSSGRTKFKGGGPGLGLALARRVVEAHGGRIWVESRGHDEKACPGSRFVIRLPIRRLGNPALQDPA